VFVQVFVRLFVK